MSRKRFIRKGRAVFQIESVYGEIPVSSEIFLCRSPVLEPRNKGFPHFLESVLKYYPL